MTYFKHISEQIELVLILSTVLFMVCSVLVISVKIMSLIWL